MTQLIDNPKGYVSLSFDFDGPSLWIQRQMTTPAPISRGEFGAIAVPRILKLLAKYEIPSTFFIPGHTIETYPDISKMVADAGCEVGIHGYAHEYNPRLSREEESWALEKSIGLIDALTGTPPSGYRAPSGDVTAQTLELLIEYGVKYDSSLQGNDYSPYYARLGDEWPADKPGQFGPETELVELPFSWNLDDYVYLEFVTFKQMLMPGLRRPDDMFANFADEIIWMTQELERGESNIVFHPQVIGRGHRLLALERWLNTLIDLGITFSRLDTIAEAFAGGQAFGTERQEQ